MLQPVLARLLLRLVPLREAVVIQLMRGTHNALATEDVPVEAPGRLGRRA